MGTLTPGVKYIYERQGGTVYAREFGSDPSTRVAIGWDWEPENNPSRVRGASFDSVTESQLWHNIRKAAKDNPALHDALERAKVLYYLGKENGNSKT